VPHPKVKLSDDSGNAVSVTSNRLDVNAYLSATPTIDIGDVSLLLGGTAASVNNGAADATTLRVTIASDTTGVLSVDDNGSTLSIDDGGGSITIDGTVDLGATDNAVLDTIATYTALALNTMISHDSAVGVTGTMTMGEAKTIDGSVFPNNVAEGDGARLACSPYGVQYVTLTGADGVSDVGGLIQAHLNTLDNAISGSEMQVDVVASLPAGSNAIGKLAANSGVDIGDVDVTSIAAGTNIIGKVSHDITGGADGVTTVSSAGTDVVLGGNVVCKKIDIQAQTDNTGLIAVGFTGVDATEATGTGVILYAGDTYSLEMVNLNLIYIDSTVSGEGVRYTYFT